MYVRSVGKSISMSIIKIIETLILLGFLFIAAWMDCKKKELPVLFLLTGIAVGIIFQLILWELSFGNILLGALIGVLFLGVGKITNQGVGYGDGWMLVATGTFLGFQKNVLLVLFSFILAAFFSIGIIIFRKKKKKDEIPFMPFLFGGYVLMLAI